MSTFMQLMEGKQGKDAVDGVRVAASGKMFYRMNGKQVRGSHRFRANSARAPWLVDGHNFSSKSYPSEEKQLDIPTLRVSNTGTQ